MVGALLSPGTTAFAQDDTAALGRMPDGEATGLTVDLKIGDAAADLEPELRVLARTLSSGEVAATAERIRIRGTTNDGAAWQAALDRFTARLAAGRSVETDVLVIDSRKPVALLCRELFAASTRQPIRFQLSGDTIRSSSYAALDRVAEFAFDCPTATIRITGHSDAMGDPAFNLDLSRRRAQSVADYLVRRGVNAERLEVKGAGASEPVADNETSYGRRQNRRIEFEVSLP